MASNSFGAMFRITTFGESHGNMVGVVIDGCPAGIELAETDIDKYLAWRRPGRNDFVSPRSEEDKAIIVSGVFSGRTTGAPLTVIVENKNKNSEAYEINKNLLKPGHANFTYQKKYGIFDYRGSGRASARETIGRVAAGAVAAKILLHCKVAAAAFLYAVGNVTLQDSSLLGNNSNIESLSRLKAKIHASDIFCPDNAQAEKMKELIKAVQAEGDSIGGQVQFVIAGLPVGLGEPIYEKFSANLAKAMFTIPAVKGFEIGAGFAAAKMRGSECNDLFAVEKDGRVKTKTNNCGGVLGGITTGGVVTGKVAFKPTPSIAKAQMTIDYEGNETVLQLPEGSRHDPCVAVRAVAVVEAMCNLVAVDALLMDNKLHLCQE